MHRKLIQYEKSANTKPSPSGTTTGGVSRANRFDISQSPLHNPMRRKQFDCGTLANCLPTICLVICSLGPRINFNNKSVVNASARKLRNSKRKPFQELAPSTKKTSIRRRRRLLYFFVTIRRRGPIGGTTKQQQRQSVAKSNLVVVTSSFQSAIEH